MDIFQICSIGIIAVVLCLVVKKDQPMIGILISISASILIFIILIPQITSVIGVIKELSESVTVGIPFITVVLKIIGISYIAEFGTQICNDAGETAVAGKIELAGKILIMTVAAPIMLSLLNLITNLLP